MGISLKLLLPKDKVLRLTNYLSPSGKTDKCCPYNFKFFKFTITLSTSSNDSRLLLINDKGVKLTNYDNRDGSFLILHSSNDIDYNLFNSNI